MCVVCLLQHGGLEEVKVVVGVKVEVMGDEVKVKVGVKRVEVVVEVRVVTGDGEALVGEVV